ncbi:MAG: caiA [Mycobacterium sp.]|nr:caiA [Mycobacterium sp.]MDT5070326.1 hypothetical protein [Mycobacterium sp.]
MDADTRELLQGSIRSLLSTQPDDLVAGLDELGWDDVVTDDEASAISLLFAEQGRAAIASAALDTVMRQAGGGDWTPLAEGGPGLVIHPLGRARSTANGQRIDIDGVALRTPASSDTAVVGADGHGSYAFVLTAAHLVDSATALAGFDPASDLHRVQLTVDRDDLGELKTDWPRATAAAKRALSSELVGNAQAMLDLAVDHVTQRIQFGRPIGANQTPRHRLAECYALLGGASELVHAAWSSGTPWDATVAKAYAGYAAHTTSRACLQVCGAMGLTSEHTLGCYVKRSAVLDALYGGWQQAMLTVGSELLRTGEIPSGPQI